MNDMEPSENQPLDMAVPGPITSSLQENPSFSLLRLLSNMFIARAQLRQTEAQDLLNPVIAAEPTPSDSLDTGKLNKLIHYIRGNNPGLY